MSNIVGLHILICFVFHCNWNVIRLWMIFAVKFTLRNNSVSIIEIFLLFVCFVLHSKYWKRWKYEISAGDCRKNKKTKTKKWQRRGYSIFWHFPLVLPQSISFCRLIIFFRFPISLPNENLLIKQTTLRFHNNSI